MDCILQYQQLSDVKPSYQKLTLPYYSVNKLKLQHNADELELHYRGLGLWDDSTKNGGSPHSDSKKEQIMLIEILDEF
jgi:hypothetical protein